MKAKVFKTETFGATDGPGVRLVVFFQGCSFRCAYCHNPESWELDSHSAYLLSVNEIIKIYKRNAPFYQNGGITISGGEPMLQYEFVYKLAKACKTHHIRLAIDTAATNIFINEDWYKKIVKYTDLWIVDIKAVNSLDHKNITGYSQLTGIKLIEMLEKLKKPYWVRYVLVKDLTDKKTQLDELGKYLAKLKHMQNFEILPYHSLATDKYKKLNIDYHLKKTPLMSSKKNNEVFEYVKNIMKKNTKH